MRTFKNFKKFLKMSKKVKGGGESRGKGPGEEGWAMR